MSAPYTKRWGAGGAVDLPSQTTPIDAQFLNAVEDALVRLLGVAPAVDTVGVWTPGGANGALVYQKITNAQIDAAAAIARTKLDFGGGLVNADIAAAAAIAYSKLNLAGSIVNADVAAGAAILASKLAGYPSDVKQHLRGDGSWLSGTLLAVQTFTAGGTYTPTAGMSVCYIEAVGGGGGGGGGAASTDQTSDSAGGGGGAGAYSAARKTAAQVGASQTVTIGAAGAAGTAGNNAGGNGGDTSVGTLVVAKGGTGGAGSAAGGPAAIAGGAGGLASGGTGDLKLNGGTGRDGVRCVNLPRSGGGGVTPIACGQPGVDRLANRNGVTVLTGDAATGFGAGGSGAAVSGGGVASAGGAGAAGFVRIWEFA